MKKSRKISQNSIPENQGLYLPETEFDSCGVGFVANIRGVKSFKIVSDAITMLENMEHRGATGFESNTGDGAGLQIQIPHELLYDEALNFGSDLPAPGFYGVGMLFFLKIILSGKNVKRLLSNLRTNLGLRFWAIGQFQSIT